MSYRIEITANTLAELAGKAMAFAVGVSNTAAYDAEHAQQEQAPDPKPARKAKKVEEVAKEPAGEPESAPLPESSSEPEAAEPEPPAPADEPVVLDFDKDVTPVVLDAVKTKGKPWVQDILAQFGVERASQVPDERFGELVGLLKDGLE
jgi:hypothetical protein